MGESPPEDPLEYGCSKCGLGFFHARGSIECRKEQEKRLRTQLTQARAKLAEVEAEIEKQASVATNEISRLALALVHAEAERDDVECWWNNLQDFARPYLDVVNECNRLNDEADRWKQKYIDADFAASRWRKRYDEADTDDAKAVIECNKLRVRMGKAAGLLLDCERFCATEPPHGDCSTHNVDPCNPCAIRAALCR